MMRVLIISTLFVAAAADESAMMQTRIQTKTAWPLSDCINANLKWRELERADLASESCKQTGADVEYFVNGMVGIGASSTDAEKEAAWALYPDAKAASENGALLARSCSQVNKVATQNAIRAILGACGTVVAETPFYDAATCGDIFDDKSFLHGGVPSGGAGSTTSDPSFRKWRMINGDPKMTTTQHTPSIYEVKFYSDVGCTEEVPVSDATITSTPQCTWGGCGSFGIANAFDGDTSTAKRWIPNVNGAYNIWIAVEWPSPKTIKCVQQWGWLGFADGTVAQQYASGVLLQKWDDALQKWSTVGPKNQECHWTHTGNVGSEDPTAFEEAKMCYGRGVSCEVYAEGTDKWDECVYRRDCPAGDCVKSAPTPYLAGIEHCLALGTKLDAFATKLAGGGNDWQGRDDVSGMSTAGKALAGECTAARSAAAVSALNAVISTPGCVVNSRTKSCEVMAKHHQTLNAAATGSSACKDVATLARDDASAFAGGIATHNFLQWPHDHFMYEIYVKSSSIVDAADCTIEAKAALIGQMNHFIKSKSCGLAKGLGDPHMTNVAGAEFNIEQTGAMNFLQIPKGQPADALLRVDGKVERIGQCKDMYIRQLSMSGSTLGSEYEFSVNPSDDANAPRFHFRAGNFTTGNPVEFYAHTRGSMRMNMAPKADSSKVTKTKVEMEIQAGKAVLLVNCNMNAGRKNDHFDFRADKIGYLGAHADIGGLLGTDDHTWVTEKTCVEPARSLFESDEAAFSTASTMIVSA